MSVVHWFPVGHAGCELLELGDDDELLGGGVLDEELVDDELDDGLLLDDEEDELLEGGALDEELLEDELLVEGVLDEELLEDELLGAGVLDEELLDDELLLEEELGMLVVPPQLAGLVTDTTVRPCLNCPETLVWSYAPPPSMEKLSQVPSFYVVWWV